MKEYESNVIYEHGGLRLSLLTPCLLRVEKGNPTDLPTQTVANRIIEIKEDGSIADRLCTYDEYMDLIHE